MRPQSRGDGYRGASAVKAEIDILGLDRPVPVERPFAASAYGISKAGIRRRCACRERPTARVRSWQGRPLPHYQRRVLSRH